VHARSLRTALVTGDRIEITEPGESEDFGVDQADPCTLDCFGEREPAGPWSWHGPARTVTGRAGGGCVEAIEETFIAGRFPFAPDVLDGGVLLPETPEGLPPARHVGWIVRRWATACRRGGALALRRADLDPDQCLVLLQEKGETVRWQPDSPTLMGRPDPARPGPARTGRRAAAALRRWAADHVPPLRPPVGPDRPTATVGADPADQHPLDKAHHP